MGSLCSGARILADDGRCASEQRSVVLELLRRGRHSPLRVMRSKVS